MNCREFTTIVSDLASASLMDVVRRDAGLQHAENCAVCAAQLADEQALVGGLKAISKLDIDSTPLPSAAAEENIRAAFRKFQIEQKQVLKHIPAPPQVAGTGHRRRFLLVAAALIALFGGTWIISTVWSGRVNEKLQATVAPEAKKPEVIPSATPFKSPDQPTDTRDLIAVGNRPTGKRGSRISTVSAAAGSTDDSEITVSIGDLTPMTNESEVATDFIPLLLGGDLPPVDSGQVIRVEMPRTALASFGLPFNVDRANELVKADVLVGDDGLARAVRFVR